MRGRRERGEREQAFAAEQGWIAHDFADKGMQLFGVGGNGEVIDLHPCGDAANALFGVRKR
jgi:hypothetical protein